MDPDRGDGRCRQALSAAPYRVVPLPLLRDASDARNLRGDVSSFPRTREKRPAAERRLTSYPDPP
jgi:hypothetical protein